MEKIEESYKIKYRHRTTYKGETIGSDIVKRKIMIIYMLWFILQVLSL